MKLAALVLALAALAFVVPANAQVTGAHELKTTVPAKGVAGKPGQIDYYYFAGEAGSRQTFTWTGKGQAMLILFTPDGDAMVEAEGSGTVKLEAVLSWTDVYSVAVVRKNPALAYTLARQATVPTFGEAEFATWVGYQDDKKKWAMLDDSGGSESAKLCQRGCSYQHAVGGSEDCQSSDPSLQW